MRTHVDNVFLIAMSLCVSIVYGHWVIGCGENLKIFGEELLLWIVWESLFFAMQLLKNSDILFLKGYT